MPLDLEKIDLGAFGIADADPVEGPVNRPEEHLRSNMDEAFKINPDVQAKNSQLSRDSGVPEFAVEGDPSDVEHGLKLDQIDFSGMSRRSPHTSKFLTDFNNSVIAQDDIDVLEEIESVLQAVPAGFIDQFGRAFEGAARTVEVGGRFTARAFDLLLPESADKYIFNQEDSPAILKFLNKLEPAAPLRAEGEGLKRGAAAIRPEDTNLATDIAEGVGQAVGQIVTILTAPQVGFGSLFAQGVDIQGEKQERTGTEGQGVTSDLALLSGGAVTAITERAGLDRLMSRVPPQIKNRVLRQVVDIAIAGGVEAVQETVEGITQNLLEQFTTNPDAEIFEGVGREAITAGGVGVVLRSIINLATPGKARTVIAAEEQSEALATTEQTQIDRLNAGSEASTLRGRDAEAFRQFMQQADGDNNTQVYIDAVQASLYLQSKTRDEIDADAALQLLDSQVAEASAAGGDVVIPVADFATDVAGTEHFDALRDSMTLSSETAAPFRQEQVQQETQNFVETLLEEAQENVSQFVEAQEVFNTVRDQLVDTGVISPQHASVMAQIVPAWATVHAQKNGITVQEAYARTELSIEGPQTGEAARLSGEQVLEQRGVVDTQKAEDLLSEISEFAEVSEGGLVTVYHRTSTENAAAIRGSGNLIPLEDGVFFSTKRDGEAEGFGDAVIEFKIPADLLELDDIFEGEAHVKIPTAARKEFDVTDLLAQPPVEAHQEIRVEGDPEIESVPVFQAPGSKFEISTPTDPGATQPRQLKIESPGASLSANLTEDGVYQIESAKVDQPGEGTGVAMYEELITFADAQGLSVVSDKRVSAAAVRVYESLERRGYAVERAADIEIDEDGNARSATAAFTVSPPEAVAPADPRLRQETPAEGEARGYYDPANSVIRLTESADLSTFLHEFAHFMYEMELTTNSDTVQSINSWYKRNAVEVAAEATGYLDGEFDVLKQGERVPGRDTPVTEADVVAFLDTGDTGSRDKNSAIRRAVHEQFARGFEVYLMEGKSPSIELRNAFRTFARWLGQIYRGLRGNRDVTLDAEMREVFDRLLATEEQIAAAEARARYEPMFTDAAMAGMAESEFAEYQKRQERVKDVQAETLRDKLIQQFTRQTKKWWKEEKQDHIDDELDSLNKQQVYSTGNALRGAEIKLDHATVKDMFGEQKVDRLGRTSTVIPKELRGMTAKGAQGVHPDEAAAFFGYTSGSQMIEDIMTAPPIGVVADENAEARMVEEHGDILTDGTIEQQADEAVQNEERGKLILSELKALSKGTAQPTLDRGILKAMAEERVSRLSFKEIHPGKYRKAEIRAAQESAMALAAGNREGAAQAKARQVLNYYLGLAAVEARNETTKIVDRMARYNKKKVREEIQKAGNQYWEQIVKILNRFEFRKSATLVSVDQLNADINTWARERNEVDGDALVLTNAVLNESFVTHWKNVPFGDLQGINDSVKNMEHVARYSNKITRQQEEVDFKSLVSRWVDSMNATVPETRFISRRTDVVEGRNWGRWFMAQMTKIPFMASWLDGGERAGISHDILVQPFTEAYNAEIKMWDEVGSVVADAINGRDRATRKRHNAKIFIPAIDDNLYMHQIIAVALNTGNAGNLRKLLLGEGWANPENDQEISFDNPKLQAVLAHMHASDWQMVQLIWDQMEILYPRLSAVHKETTGLVPPKVEATPVTTPAGELRGGYYPVKYDPNRDQRAQENEDRLNAQTESMFSNSASIQASVNTGATNERTGYYAPIRLSLDVVPAHFQETIHYITHHAPVRETNKLIRNPQVTAAIKEKLGPEEYAQLRPWLDSIAKDGRESPTKMFWDDMLGRLRFGVTLGVMGFKASTGIIQISGLSNTIAEVGLGPVMQSLRSILGSTTDMKNAWDFAVENSNVMEHRAQTMDREIKNAMRRIEGKRGILAAAQETSMKHIALIQTYMVDLPSWHAAYIKGMEDWGDEERAFRHADFIIENVQGSGATQNLAAIMRGQSETARMFTMFMTFFSSMWNLERDLVKGAKSGRYSVTSVAAKSMFLFAIPVLFEMIMRGDLGGDDEEPGAQLQKYLTRVAMFPLQSMPFIRDVVSASTGEYGYNISPLASVIEQGTRTIPKIVTSGFTDDEITKGHVKGASKFIGAAVGIPGINQLWATGEHLSEVIEDGEEFTVHQLLFGPERE